MEPKFILVFEKNYYDNPFAVYEQAMFPDGLAQHLHSRYDRIETALRALSSLNNGEPILLAYSTKPVDNTFTA